MIRSESDMIRIARVLCIFFMMSVHVPPGSEISVINTGGMAWLGTIWQDILGRASVAALSFISGYLLIGSAAQRSLGEMIKRRWAVLIVPMLLWNSIFVLLVLGAGLSGHDSTAWEKLVEASPSTLLNLLTGLYGPTLNLSLVFLRDMFVCSVLILSFWHWIRAIPLASLMLFLAIALFDWLDPLVLRPSILLFMVAGALCRDHGISLSRLAEKRFGLPIMIASVVLLAILRMVPHDGHAMHELANLLLRTSLVFGCLILVGFLARYSIWQKMGRISDSIFLVYLSHVPIMSILWVAWKHYVGGPIDPSYIAFFVSTPLMAIFAGLGLNRLLRKAPQPLRRAVSGRS